MRREFDMSNAQRPNSVFELHAAAAHTHDIPWRELENGTHADSAGSCATGGQRRDVPYHARWAVIQVGVTLALWVVIIAGAMLVVSRL